MVGGAQNQNLVSRKPYLDHLKKIPEFDGESYKALRNFLDIAGALNESWTNDVERNNFIDTLSLQLRGEARDVVGNLYQSSFDEMRDKLLKYFSYLINKEIVTSQLENIRQNDKETMSEYAERARKLLREKCNTYKFLSEEQKKEYDRTARRAFARGITESSIRDRLITRGAGSLEDAISYAIEADFDASITIPNSELYCKFCKINGHREANCWKKSSNASGINQLINFLGNVKNPDQNTRNSSNSRGRGNRSNGNWNNSRQNSGQNSGQNWSQNSNQNGNYNNKNNQGNGNYKGWNNSGNPQNRGSNQSNQNQKNSGNQWQKGQNSRPNTRNEAQNATATVQAGTSRQQTQDTEN